MDTPRDHYWEWEQTGDAMTCVNCGAVVKCRPVPHNVLRTVQVEWLFRGAGDAEFAPMSRWPECSSKDGAK